MLAELAEHADNEAGRADAALGVVVVGGRLRLEVALLSRRGLRTPERLETSHYTESKDVGTWVGSAKRGRGRPPGTRQAGICGEGALGHSTDS